jgi:hypothetical protein
MWDPDTKRVQQNIDIIWLEKFFDNTASFINISNIPNANSRNIPTSNKASLGLLLGHKVSKYHKVMKVYFECDNISSLKEYVGCKIEERVGDNRILIVWPVFI